MVKLNQQKDFTLSKEIYWWGCWQASDFFIEDKMPKSAREMHSSPGGSVSQQPWGSHAKANMGVCNRKGHVGGSPSPSQSQETWPGVKLSRGEGKAGCSRGTG